MTLFCILFIERLSFSDCKCASLGWCGLFFCFLQGWYPTHVEWLWSQVVF